MAQEDYNVANGSGSAVRADINAQLAAVVSQNSGNSAPTTTFANMFWLDTTTTPAILKVRNKANSAWLDFDDVNDVSSWSKSTLVPKTANYTGLTADAGETTVMNGTDLVYTTPTVNATNHELVFTVQNINATDLTITTVTGVATLGENESCTFIVDNTNSECRALGSHTASSSAIVGQSIMFAGTSAPSGTLAEEGQAISRTTYADLFTAIGTTWGVGDGSTTFNLPDPRERYKRCKGATNAVGATLANQNKSHNHTASSNSTGSHTHVIKTAGGSGGGLTTINDIYNYQRLQQANGAEAAGTHSHTITVNSNGGTEARPDSAVYLSCIITGV